MNGSAYARARTFLSHASPFGRIAASYLLAALVGDRARAVGSITQAVEGGVSMRDNYRSVLEPVQREVGRLWHQDEISVAEEHFVTTTTATALGALYPVASGGRRTAAPQ